MAPSYYRTPAHIRLRIIKCLSSTHPHYQPGINEPSVVVHNYGDHKDDIDDPNGHGSSIFVATMADRVLPQVQQLVDDLPFHVRALMALHDVRVRVCYRYRDPQQQDCKLTTGFYAPRSRTATLYVFNDYEPDNPEFFHDLGATLAHEIIGHFLDHLFGDNGIDSKSVTYLSERPEFQKLRQHDAACLKPIIRRLHSDDSYGMLGHERGKHYDDDKLYLIERNYGAEWVKACHERFAVAMERKGAGWSDARFPRTSAFADDVLRLVLLPNEQPRFYAFGMTEGRLTLRRHIKSAPVLIASLREPAVQYPENRPIPVQRDRTTDPRP
jgi:hypothetical protein